MNSQVSPAARPQQTTESLKGEGSQKSNPEGGRLDRTAEVKESALRIYEKRVQLMAGSVIGVSNADGYGETALLAIRAAEVFQSKWEEREELLGMENCAT